MKTIAVDFDHNSWLYVPISWPWGDYATAEDWATGIAGLLADYHELDAEAREWLATSMLAARDGIDEGEARYLYLANPGELFFFVSVLYADSDESISLEDLAGIEGTATMGKTQTEVFESPSLGNGLKATRFVDAGEPNHDIAGITQYAWRSQGLDVVVIFGDFKLVRVHELAPVIDEFARSISVIEA